MKKVLIALILLLVLISCKQKDSGLNKATNINAINPNATDTYRSTILIVPNDMFDVSNRSEGAISVTGDRIIINGWIYDDRDDPYDTKTATYSCDWNGENYRMETSELSASGETFLLSDGSKIVSQWIWENNVLDGMIIQKYSANNKLVFENTVDSLFAIDLKSQMTDYAIMSGDFFQIINAVQTSDGTIYLASQKKLVALDENGVKLFDIQISGEVTNLAALTDDSVIVKYGDTRGNVYIKYVDAETQKLGEEIVLPDIVDMRNSQIILGPGYDLYIKNFEGLFGYNIGGEPILVIDWHKSNTIATGMQMFIVITPEKFVYTAMSFLTYETELVLLDMIPKDELKERTPITLAQLSYYQMLDYYILYFNRENPDYRIEVIDYSKYNTEDDRERGVMIFNAEIAAGNIPDIVMWGDYNGFPIQSYKEKGLFRDLYQLMGKDIDLLMPFAYKPFEDNGKLYQFLTSISFETYAGKKSFFPKTPMTPMEMINYENSLREDQHLRDSMWNTWFSARTILDFVDNENHKVYFDSDEFIAILGHNTGKTPPEHDPDDRYAHYRNDTILLYRMNMYNFDDYMYLKFYFREDITFVGYPTLSDNGAIVRPDISFGITEKSKHAEMAWQFLKRTLADEIQYPVSAQRYSNARSFPITVSAMDKYIDNILNRVYVFFGRGHASYLKPMPEDAQQGYEIEITREEIDYILDYMASAKAVNSEDFNFLYWQIIFEELQSGKTPEEIAKVIQSRASIYINERR